jgi:hypothetical protein
VLAWVVTFRLTLRRSRKSHSLCVLPRSTRVASPSSSCFPLTFSSNSLPLNSFAGPHLLNPYAAIFYKNNAGKGCASGSCPSSSRTYALFANSFPCHTSENSSVSPIAATDPKTFSHKSFRCHTSETPLGGLCHFASTGSSRLCPATVTGHESRVTLPSSHCGGKPLVQQFAKARDFFPIRGNNSAPPGV